MTPTPVPERLITNPRPEQNHRSPSTMPSSAAPPPPPSPTPPSSPKPSPGTNSATPVMSGAYPLPPPPQSLLQLPTAPPTTTSPAAAALASRRRRRHRRPSSWRGGWRPGRPPQPLAQPRQQRLMAPIGSGGRAPPATGPRKCWRRLSIGRRMRATAAAAAAVACCPRPPCSSICLRCWRVGRLCPWSLPPHRRRRRRVE